MKLQAVKQGLTMLLNLSHDSITTHKTFDTSCLLSNERDIAKTIYARNVILVIFNSGGRVHSCEI